jgi:hypothetical protein
MARERSAAPPSAEKQAQPAPKIVTAPIAAKAARVPNRRAPASPANHPEQSRRLQPSASWRLLLPWASALLMSFVLFALIGVIQIGGHRFWHYVTHPAPQAGPFDLLYATLPSIITVALAIYFGAAAVVVAAAARGSSRTFEAFLQLVGSGWLFYPGLFWFLSINLLLGPALGFPRFWVGIPFTIAIGVGALLGLVKLCARFPAVLRADEDEPSTWSQPSARRAERDRAVTSAGPNSRA